MTKKTKSSNSKIVYKISDFTAKILEENSSSKTSKSAVKILKNVKKLGSRSESVQEKALLSILKSVHEIANKN